jgi:alpha-ketoglutarate-dependent taurine dioxygenase
MVSSSENNPVRQFVAAWQAAATVATDWAQQTAAVTSEAFRRLASDPAIRAVLEEWRVTVAWNRRDCECSCVRSHPDDVGICDKVAVITRRLPTDQRGDVEVPLCAPCAVAQGVAEMPR